MHHCICVQGPYHERKSVDTFEKVRKVCRGSQSTTESHGGTQPAPEGAQTGGGGNEADQNEASTTQGLPQEE